MSDYLETVSMILKRHLGDVRFERADYDNALACRWRCDHGVYHPRTINRSDTISADGLARVVAEELKHSCRRSCGKLAEEVAKQKMYSAGTRWHHDALLTACAKGEPIKGLKMNMIVFDEAPPTKEAYRDALVTGRGHWRMDPTDCRVSSIADSVRDAYMGLQTKMLLKEIAKSPTLSKFFTKSRKDRRLLLLRR